MAAAPAPATAPTTLMTAGAAPPIAALWATAKRLPEATVPIAACQPAARLPREEMVRMIQSFSVQIEQGTTHHSF
jgi:hypothetical protein